MTHRAIAQLPLDVFLSIELVFVERAEMHSQGLPNKPLIVWRQLVLLDKPAFDGLEKCSSPLFSLALEPSYVRENSLRGR